MWIAADFRTLWRKYTWMIPNFKEDTVRRATTSENQPSVRRWISDHNLHERTVWDAAHALADGRVKVSLNLHNVTVRQALDAIVVASGLKWWGIIEWDTPNGNRINRISISM
jgi:hypothetical protein